MNIYARYFDHDILVHSYDELVSFLKSIPEIPIDQHLLDDIQAYITSDLPYPKRYKIRPRVYFILIKTAAETMEDFKAHRKDLPPAPKPVIPSMAGNPILNKKELRAAQLAETHEGWYLGTIAFKRVIQIAETQKFRYQDTTFQAYVRASSGLDCYNRILEHLKDRPEVDVRSQFPSARGLNFTFKYMGTELPAEVQA